MYGSAASRLGTTGHWRHDLGENDIHFARKGLGYTYVAVHAVRASEGEIQSE
jgi:hypothetical protein